MMNNGAKWQIVRHWRTICNSLIMSVNVCKNIAFYNSPAMAGELKMLNGEEMER